MNLNAFIFLIAGAIAYLITNRITSSFKLIKEKMKAVNWQSHNDEIVWNKDDEIGALVKEYNIMVKKLDETAKAFALSQREKAWKEMAMQVAHEIKNPLTPMKLSIQYLQKNIDDNAPNIKELSKNVATTLIEQIDQLTTIASDFSQFANIGNNNIEKVNINSILTNLLNLYVGDARIKINHNIADTKQFVNADKIQMTRLFTNLIKNAIEASGKNEIIKIQIEQSVAADSIIIAIKDDGTGISEELQQKIFTLNFTTKSSGTGLGLAICKGIVENSNGKIWFETSTNGTIFFVELPLIKE
jgi:nitrogen fixation/metabolism regulation signal transduction histidine kinase